MTDFARDFSRTDYYVKEVLSVIKEGLPHVEKCRGRDITVLIGLPNSKKSIVRSATLFGPMKREGERMVPINPVPKEYPGEFDELPLPGRDFKLITTPQAFEMTDGSILLDTMDYYNTYERDYSHLGSLAIFKRCLKIAKSVKVVCVLNSTNISHGLVGMHVFLEFLRNIIPSQDVPILFLVNVSDQSFPCDSKWTSLSIRLSRAMKTNPNSKKCESIRKEMNDCALEMIREQFKMMEKGRDSIISGIKERCMKKARDLGEDEGYLDEESMEVLNMFSYIDLIESNIEKGNCCCFDPTSKSSIDHFLECVNSLDTIDPDMIIDSMFSLNVNEFKEMLRARLVVLNKAVRVLRLSKKYNAITVRRKIGEIEYCLRETERIMSEFERSEHVLKEDLEVHVKQLCKRTESIEGMMKDKMKERKELKECIEAIENQDPIPFCTYKIAAKGWTPLCTIKYDGDVPIAFVKENPGDKTEKKETIKYNVEEGEYEAVFGTTSWKKWYVIGGTVVAIVGVGLLLYYTPAGPFLVKIAKKAFFNEKMLLRILNLIEEKLITHVTSKDRSVTGTCVNFLCGFGSIVVGSLGIPFLEDIFTPDTFKTLGEKYHELGCSTISGTVEIYVYPRNIPENKVIIAKKTERIRQLDSEIDDLRYGLDSINRDLKELIQKKTKKIEMEEYKQSLSYKANCFRTKIECLENWLGFVSDAGSLLEQSSRVIDDYHDILSFFFDDPSKDVIVCRFFKDVDDLSLTGTGNIDEMNPMELSECAMECDDIIRLNKIHSVSSAPPNKSSQSEEEYQSK